jgi:hypothetical protein
MTTIQQQDTRVARAWPAENTTAPDAVQAREGAG